MLPHEYGYRFQGTARVAKKPEKEAPAPEGEEGAEGEAPAKKKPPILIIAIAAGVLVLGGGGAAAFFLMKPKPEAEHAKSWRARQGKEERQKEGRERRSRRKKARAAEPLPAPARR
jgi:flagellar FliL protein